jgi:dipeptidyl-peptidase-3
MRPFWLSLIVAALVSHVSLAQEVLQQKKAGSEKQTEPRKYLLERVDDVGIVQLYVDGFEKLPLNDKLLIYHLSLAVVAGRDIFIDQKYAHALEIRDLIEEIICHADGVEPATLAEIRRYTKLFWVNNGPHSALTSQKNILRCKFDDFAQAARQAEKNGAKLPTRDGEKVDQMLARLQPILFSAEVDSHCTSKSPVEGKDILQASANNFYDRGITLKDLDGFQERYALNSKLIKKADGKLDETVWRAGFDNIVPEGMYAKQIRNINSHLEAAIPYASPQMARTLGSLIHFYRTGEAVDFREYNIAWVKDKDSPVDTINGFIEVYVDARGQKGSWEGIVYFNDPEKMEMITKFSEHAQWFEDHMPYDAKYRKPEVKGISAKAIQVVMEAGDAGPVTPIGINLPNPGDIREQYGSKSVSLTNVIDASDKSSSAAARAEFCFDEAEFQRLEKWKSIMLALEVNMHEVIGHASGRVSPELKIDPVVEIKEYYSALEEGRADLVALWFIGDPKLVELGLVKNENELREIQQAAYEDYTRNAMVQLRRVRTGTTLEEDHMRNRQMIVHWLAANTNAINVEERDGKTYFRVRDYKAWHEGIGRLLKEVQRIKSEGDRAAATEMMKRYAITINTKLRDEVVARFAKLDRPAYSGFVMPKLSLLRGENGRVTDVKISYPLDIEQQMLEWSGRRAPKPANTINPTPSK